MNLLIVLQSLHFYGYSNYSSDTITTITTIMYVREWRTVSVYQHGHALLHYNTHGFVTPDYLDDVRPGISFGYTRPRCIQSVRTNEKLFNQIRDLEQDCGVKHVHGLFKGTNSSGYVVVDPCL